MTPHPHEVLWQKWFRVLEARIRGKAPQPKPAPKPSAQAVARNAGWTQREPGYWTHPTFGTVERERNGTWTGRRGAFTVTGSPTMLHAMNTLAANAPEVDANAICSRETGEAVLASLMGAPRKETVEIDGEPREITMYGFGNPGDTATGDTEEVA